MKKTLTPCASNFCRSAIRAALVPFCEGCTGASVKSQLGLRKAKMVRQVAHVGVKDGHLADIVAEVLCHLFLEREADLGPELVRLGRPALCVKVVWWQLG